MGMKKSKIERALDVNVNDLKHYAGNLGISNYSRMRRQELIGSLMAHPKIKKELKLGWFKIPKWIKGVIIIIIIPTILTGFYYLLEVNKEIIEQKKKATSGIISTKIDLNEKYVWIKVGSNQIRYQTEFLIDGKRFDPSVMLNLRGEYPIEFWLDETGIKIDATINSIDGKIVAQIKNNEWLINPNNYFDRNYDKFGFEVIGEYGLPIIQIDATGNNEIYIGGIYYLENDLVIINKDGVYRLGDTGSIKEVLNYAKGMERIFKYPSDLHLSERQDSLSSNR